MDQVLTVAQQFGDRIVCEHARRMNLDQIATDFIAAMPQLARIICEF